MGASGLGVSNFEGLHRGKSIRQDMGVCYQEFFVLVVRKGEFCFHEAMCRQVVGCTVHSVDYGRVLQVQFDPLGGLRASPTQGELFGVLVFR